MCHIAVVNTAEAEEEEVGVGRQEEGGRGGRSGTCFEAINSVSLPLMTLFLNSFFPPSLAPSASDILHNAGEDQA